MAKSEYYNWRRAPKCELPRAPSNKCGYILISDGAPARRCLENATHTATAGVKPIAHYCTHHANAIKNNLVLP